MAGMTQARVALQESLQEAGLSVKNHIPGSVVPPLVIMASDSPMLDHEVQTFNSVQYDYHLILHVVGGTQATETALKTVEEMTEKVLLNLGDWTVDAVSDPVLRPANDKVFLTVSIRLHNTITIGEEV